MTKKKRNNEKCNCFSCRMDKTISTTCKSWRDLGFAIEFKRTSTDGADRITFELYKDYTNKDARHFT